MAIVFRSDSDLIRELGTGDGRSIEFIYERYAPLAHAVAMKVLGDRTAAEDVVQEAFMALWRNASAFDPQRGQVRSWLLRIVRNRAIDRLRGSTRHWEVTDIEQVSVAVQDNAWDHVAAVEDRMQVRHLLSALPVDQRRTIELGYFGDLSQTEIAARLHLPLGTVKSRMRLALERMRQTVSWGSVH